MKIQDEIIVVSDIHGNIEKWNQLKKMINNNPKLKVIILGDATDRGDYGPEILLGIKELNDEGKVSYLPGNHDVFAYNYMKMRNNPSSRIFINAKGHLKLNAGNVTVEKLEKLDDVVSSEMKKGNIKNKITADELMNWLGNRPVQRKLKRFPDGKTTYYFAHAIFDEALYKYDLNFSLEKALNLELEQGSYCEMVKRFQNVMWYRKDDLETHNYKLDLPKKGVMIVGHTRQKEISFDYENPKAPIICVDTGKGDFEGYSLNKKEPVKILSNQEKVK